MCEQLHKASSVSPLQMLHFYLSYRPRLIISSHHFFCSTLLSSSPLLPQTLSFPQISPCSIYCSLCLIPCLLFLYFLSWTDGVISEEEEDRESGQGDIVGCEIAGQLGLYNDFEWLFMLHALFSP